jgi:hypothetical protein
MYFCLWPKKWAFFDKKLYIRKILVIIIIFILKTFKEKKWAFGQNLHKTPKNTRK